MSNKERAASRQRRKVDPADRIADMVNTTQRARASVEAEVARIVHQEKVNPLGNPRETQTSVMDERTRHVETQTYMGD